MSKKPKTLPQRIKFAEHAVDLIERMPDISGNERKKALREVSAYIDTLLWPNGLGP